MKYQVIDLWWNSATFVYLLANIFIIRTSCSVNLKQINISLSDITFITHVLNEENESMLFLFFTTCQRCRFSKFIYSEKGHKICQNLPVDFFFSYLVNIKYSTWKIRDIFVAFSDRIIYELLTVFQQVFYLFCKTLWVVTIKID